ncbi:MAG: RDD domain containing protein [Gammaproteobacteria bacterium]|nr:RDD domain containing protein [Gammaproteobacteria bacterium]
MLRRLAAITYDLMLLYAVLFFVTIILNIVFDPATIQNSKILYPVSLLLCCYWYFVWHWLHGRQTLGMKAWRLILVRADNSPLHWQTASIRFLLAGGSILFFGFGLFWALFDRKKLTFYDRYAGTVLNKSVSGLSSAP